MVFEKDLAGILIILMTEQDQHEFFIEYSTIISVLYALERKLERGSNFIWQSMLQEIK